MRCSNTTRDRAVLLLQYLATGLNSWNEHELVLNKILCAVPFAEAIATEFEPTEEEIRVTEDLFDVVKERWPQVKDTTVELIRNTFVLRGAVLKVQENGWLMQVEQRGYDIVLESLPWSFGFVKTQIMDKPIFVEWT